MAGNIPNGTVFRFGIFQADLRSGELLKRGVRIHLQQQPFQVLAVLLRRAGEIVTREELKQTLWPNDTFVDFDEGLGAAIYKIRQALGDSAQNPRFVETLSRRGYRFLSPVTHADQLTRAGDDTFRIGVTVPLSPEELVAASDATSAPVAPESKSSAEVKSEQFAAPRERPQQPTMLRHWFALHGWKVATLMLLLLAIGLASWRLAGRPVERPAIAVLPFKNLASTPANDYFTDGLTYEIIRNLSVVDGLQVRSGTSSFALKNKPENIRQVGARLGVNLVLEGSVLRAGDRLRVDAELIRVADDQPLWSGRFDRGVQDVMEIQDEISRSIVYELRLKLSTGHRHYKIDPNTYDTYLKARSLSNRVFVKVEKGKEALVLFQQVVDRHPEFAPAYAGLATTYADVEMSQRFAPFPVDEAYAQMRAAAEKALQLDPLSAEAYVSMGLVYQRELAWPRAEKAFRRAIELNPNIWTAHWYLGYYLLAAGRIKDAESEGRRAIEIDPLDADVRTLLGGVLLSEGRYQEAVKISRDMLAMEPKNTIALQFLARALAQQGEPQEAVHLLEGRLGCEQYLGYSLAKAGRRTEAERLAAKFSQWPNVQAPIYAGLGDKDRTFAALEEMAQRKDVRVDIEPQFPEFSALRNDPRMKKLRTQRGLPWP